MKKKEAEESRKTDHENSIQIYSVVAQLLVFSFGWVPLFGGLLSHRPCNDVQLTNIHKQKMPSNADKFLATFIYTYIYTNILFSAPDSIPRVHFFFFRFCVSRRGKELRYFCHFVWAGMCRWLKPQLFDPINL